MYIYIYIYLSIHLFPPKDDWDSRNTCYLNQNKKAESLYIFFKNDELARKRYKFSPKKVKQ